MKIIISSLFEISGKRKWRVEFFKREYITLKL